MKDHYQSTFFKIIVIDKKKGPCWLIELKTCGKFDAIENLFLVSNLTFHYNKFEHEHMLQMPLHPLKMWSCNLKWVQTYEG